MVDSVIDSEKTTLNPWFSIWIKPRVTLRGILNRPRRRGILWLAMAGGMAHLFHGAEFGQPTSESLNQAAQTLTTPELLMGVAAAGALAGLIYVYFGAVLLEWTGRWLGGKGSARQLQAAIAWSGVPMVWGLPAWLLIFSVDHQALYVGLVPAGSVQIGVAWLLAIAQFVIPAWWLVVYLNCVGQAQGFSAWRALANTAIAHVMLAVVVAATLFGGAVIMIVPAVFQYVAG